MYKKIFLIICAVAITYVGWAYYSLTSFNVALMSGDHKSVSRSVDWVALRDSVRGQVVAAATKEMNKAAGANSLGAGLAVMMAQTAVDSYVSPTGLQMMFESSKGDSSGKGLKPSKYYFDGALDFISVEMGQYSPIKATFQLQGLRWRLVAADMGVGLAAANTASAKTAKTRKTGKDYVEQSRQSMKAGFNEDNLEKLAPAYKKAQKEALDALLKETEGK